MWSWFLLYTGQPRGDTRVIPGGMRRLKAQRAAEAELRRAAFDLAADDDTGNADATPIEPARSLAHPPPSNQLPTVLWRPRTLDEHYCNCDLSGCELEKEGPVQKQQLPRVLALRPEGRGVMPRALLGH